MRSFFRGINVVATLMCWYALGANAETHAEVVLDGKIDQVTIYRDQARIIRTVEIPPAADLQQIRVPDLPREMEVRSAFTESDTGTQVRSMRIVPDRTKAAPELEARLEQLRTRKGELLQQLRSQEQKAKAIERDLLTIEELVDFSAAKVHENLDRATLDVESVTALADFTMERRRRLAEELLETQSEIEQLNKDIQENDEQQSDWAIENAKSSYEALLAVNSPDGGVARLVYDVNNVSWFPRYSVRSQQGDDGVRSFKLQLDAVLIQDSGESWSDVLVTLSTSTPDIRAARPLLTPLRVQAIAPGEQAISNADTSLSGDLPAWLDRNGLEQNAELNTQANQRQVTEMTSVAEVERTLAEDAGEDLGDETYRIEGRIQVTSQPQLQTIAILATDLPGDMHYVVTPLLTSFAFREADLTNTSGKNLIAGEADVYLDGDFVGRTTLPPTADGQRLTVGFGSDRKIRTRRELLSKEESVQGGNRRSTLTHRLVIANYHDAPMAIRLLDRIPIAAKDGSITVELDSTSTTALSDDPLYVRMLKPTGVLRWDLEIPAKRFGSNTFDHEYTYSIELDRQKTIISNDLSKTMDDLQFQKMNMGGGMGGGFF